MTTDRMTRVDEQLRRLIGEALFRVMNETDIDLSAITVTHVITNSDLRSARVLISIRDNTDKRDWMMNQLRKHRSAIQQYISKHVAMRYTPRLTFALDASLERGDHILSLLSEIETEQKQRDHESGTPTQR